MTNPDAAALIQRAQQLLAKRDDGEWYSQLRDREAVEIIKGLLSLLTAQEAALKQFPISTAGDSDNPENLEAKVTALEAALAFLCEDYNLLTGQKVTPESVMAEVEKRKRARP